jgi:hypothetical protein
LELVVVVVVDLDQMVLPQSLMLYLLPGVAPVKLTKQETGLVADLEEVQI